MPGVGISIGLTRLFFVLQEIGFGKNYNINSKLNFLILPVGNTLKYCKETINYLQSKGYNVDIFFENTSLKKKISYADKLGVDNVVFIGEEEMINNIVKVKNMNTGEEIVTTYQQL